MFLSLNATYKCFPFRFKLFCVGEVHVRLLNTVFTSAILCLELNDLN